MEFKDKVLFVRAKLNMTQTELAKALGVAYITVNRWENGNVQPTKKAQLIFEMFCQEKGIIVEEEGI